MNREDLPLAVVFNEVFSFLAERPDAVVFGAHAVNAYAKVERMTQGVDVLTPRAERLAEDLRAHLRDRFQLTVGVRPVARAGLRAYQLRDGKNRHLVDVRQTHRLPPFRSVEGIRVVELVELVVMKVASMTARRGREKGLSDRLDLHRLLNAFPELRTADGAVAERLGVHEESVGLLRDWGELLLEKIEADHDEWTAADAIGARAG